jgi:hypothetical protein
MTLSAKAKDTMLPALHRRNKTAFSGSETSAVAGANRSFWRNVWATEIVEAAIVPWGYRQNYWHGLFGQMKIKE